MSSLARCTQAVAAREAQDVALLEEKLNRKLSKDERSQIGVSRLRWFLEQLLQRRLVEFKPIREFYLLQSLDTSYKIVQDESNCNVKYLNFVSICFALPRKI